MTRRDSLRSLAALVLPLAALAAWCAPAVTARPQARASTGDCCRDCCPDCPPDCCLTATKAEAPCCPAGEVYPDCLPAVPLLPMTSPA